MISSFFTVTVAISLLLVISPEVNGQLPYAGICPRLPARPDFDFHRYSGEWYEVEKYFFLIEITGTCVWVDYIELKNDNSSFNAEIVQVDAFTRKNIRNAISGKIVSDDGSAEIDITVSINLLFPPMTVKIHYPYSILDTDYETFSIKWACRQFGAVNYQDMWILSRTREYPQEVREKVHARLREFGLDPGNLVLTDHTNCPSPRTKDVDVESGGDAQENSDVKEETIQSATI